MTSRNNLTDRQLLARFLPVALQQAMEWNKKKIWISNKAVSARILDTTPQLLAYCAMELAVDMLAELNRRAPLDEEEEIGPSASTTTSPEVAAPREAMVRFNDGPLGREATVYVDCDYCNRRYPVHLRAQL